MKFYKVYLLSFFLIFFSSFSLYAEVSGTYSYFTVSSYSILGDGSSPCTVTCYIRDEAGSPLSGRQAQISTSRGIDSTTIVPSQIQSTNASGQCTWTLTSSYPGKDTISITCEGKSIGKNYLKNSSFEDSKDYWDLYGSGDSYSFQIEESPTYVHSGSRSARLYANNGVLVISQGTSAYNGQKGGTVRGSYYFYLAKPVIEPTHAELYFTIYYTDEDYTSIPGVHADGSLAGQWQYLELTGTVNPSKTINRIVVYLQVSTSPGENITAWFDDVQLQTPSVIEFVAPVTKLKITSSPFSILLNSPCKINVEAWNSLNIAALNFNDTGTVSSTSPKGQFSSNLSTWSEPGTSYVTTFHGGFASFYYKDAEIGNPIITVSSTGLESDSQVGEVKKVVISTISTSSYTNSVLFQEAEKFPWLNITPYITSADRTRGFIDLLITVNTTGQWDFIKDLDDLSKNDLRAICNGIPYEMTASSLKKGGKYIFSDINEDVYPRQDNNSIQQIYSEYYLPLRFEVPYDLNTDYKVYIGTNIKGTNLYPNSSYQTILSVAEPSPGPYAYIDIEGISPLYLRQNKEQGYYYRKSYKVPKGTPISFDAGKSIIYNSSATITQYKWAFGDDNSTAYGEKITHTFNHTGSCTVSLTLTDSNGITYPAIEGALKTLELEVEEIFPDSLLSSRPNPFNLNKYSEVILPYSLSKKGKVSLKLYTISGDLVKTLIDNEEKPAGNLQCYWDGKNTEGEYVSKGIYLYQLTTDWFKETKKILVVK